MNRLNLHRAITASLLLSVLLSACSSAPQPQPTAAPIPTQTPIPPTPTALPPKLNVPYKPVPQNELSPVIVQRSPENGERLNPDGSIDVMFDRAMDQASVAAALITQPKIDGAITWKDKRTLSFKPRAKLPRNSVFDVAITQDAKSTEGAQLGAPYQFRLTTEGNLEVGQTIPANGASEIDPNTIVTVLFNRPVVPLTTLNEQKTLPQPLSCTPALLGTQEWLNTSILVFRPSQPLPGGQNYSCQVDGALVDTVGNPMASAYIFGFSTASPKVVGIDYTKQTSSYGPIYRPMISDSGSASAVAPSGLPEGAARIDTGLVIRFNQAVDAASAQAAFSLVSGRIGGQAVAGSIVISGNLLIFTPTAPLNFDTSYIVRVQPGVLSASGGVASKDNFETRFKTVPLPRIVGTQPNDGQINADPYTAFVIQFNTDIDPATVMAHLSMTPAFSPTQVYTYFDSYQHNFVLNFGAQPSTEYVVNITPGIADPYGNTTDQAITVKFKTADAPPYFNLSMPYGAATFNAYQPVQIVASALNISRIDFSLYKLPEINEFARMQFQYDQPVDEKLLFRRFTQQFEAKRNGQVRALVNMGEGDGKLAPGMYLLTATSPDLPTDQRRFPQRAFLFVSEINLTLKNEPSGALIWATDLQSGQAVGDLAIDVYGLEYKSNAQTFTLLGSTATGGDGVAKFTNTAQPDPNNNRVQPTFAIARGRFSAVSADWGNGVRIFDFGMGYAENQYASADSPLRAYIYTDRPIYRPAQKVYLRGIVRTDDDAQYGLPASGTPVQVRVSDPQGREIVNKPLTLDEYGAFSLDVDVAEGSPLGSYSVQVDAQINPNTNRTIAFSNFTVSAYRPPDYEVTVAATPTETVRGTTLNATASAKYLSGGALRNASLSWNALVRSTEFRPPQLDEFSFTDSDNPWGCFDCWYIQRNEPPPQPIAQGNGVTDNNGNFQISIPITTEIRNYAGQLISGPVSISIEANASGADNQIIAGRTSVTVHPADYYLGIATNQYVIEENKTFTISTVAVDWNGARLSGKSVQISLYRREWDSKFVTDEFGGGRWESSVKDELITQTQATSGELGLLNVPISVTQAGSYRIVARGADSAGRVVQSSRFVWATGNGYVSWFRDNNDRVNLVANKSTYLPGETADILIPSPFIDTNLKEHLALVTVERGHVRRSEVVKINSSSFVYHLPLDITDVPNVYVSVVLFKGAGQPPTPSPSPQVGEENRNRADFKVGYIGLKVEPVKQIFKITLTPDRKLAQPGETVSYNVLATDADGKPVQGQFSIDLVDKGILNLLPRTPGEIVQAFYGLRGSQVNTAVGLSVSGNRITADELNQARAQGGGLLAATDGVAREALSTAAPAAPAAAPKAEAADHSAIAASQQLATPQIRQNFADTAFWSAAITTNAEGKTSISIPLPDNLTTWVMRAVGVDGQTRVGEATVDVVATKPLLIRPVAPRFLVVNDVVELGAVVNNNTDAAQEAEVSLRGEGVSSVESVGGVGVALTQTVTVPAQGEIRANWTVSVTDAAQADLVFTVQSKDGQYADAAKPRLSTAPNGGLKINRWSAPEVIGTAGDLTEEGSRTEVVALPTALDNTQGTLTVRLDPSLAASMQAGLTYLETFPYECAEQVVSKFLPNVLTYRAMQELGLKNGELEEKLPGLVRDSLSRLYELQHSDGGWGWWRDDESNAHISAYVVFGMLKARAAGFEVNNDSLQRGIQFLQGTLKSVSPTSAFYALNEEVYKLYVLGEADQPNPEKLGELYNARDNMSHFAKAMLALALARVEKTDARIQTLFADLNGAVIQSATGAHWEEKNVDWWAMNSDTRSTAIVLDALTQLDPSNKLLPNVVRWLMVARTADGFWRSTQETAWSLIALTDWMKATNELKGNYEFGAFLNDKAIAQGQASPATITQTTLITLPVAALLQDVGNKLTIARGAGEGRLYYTAHLKAYLPVPSIKAADRGIAVQRRYTLANCTLSVEKCPEVSSVKVGDVIRVSLTLIAPSDLHYLQLEDPLPAGAEAVDTGLATTSQLAAGATLNQSSAVSGRSSYWWWWNWYSRSELRDDRVALFATNLPKGTYEYSYTMRATSVGRFNVIPAFVNEQYFPEVFGRSEGRLLVVEK